MRALGLAKGVRAEKKDMVFVKMGRDEMNKELRKLAGKGEGKMTRKRRVKDEEIEGGRGKGVVNVKY